MVKVAVGRSIAHAYTFLFGRFFQIIGTAWLPALLYGLGSYFVLSNMARWFPAHAQDTATVVSTLGAALGVAAVVMMIHGVLGISLTQEALGVRKNLTLAHFVIGPRELRLFFGYIRLYLVYVALAVLIGAIVFGAAFLARQYGGMIPRNLALNGTPAAQIAVAVLAVLLTVWMVLLVLRMAFILAPVASVEHKVRLQHAREITSGSGWRTLIVLVAVLAPVAIAAYAAFYALYPNDIANFMQQMSRLKPGELPDVASFYGAHAGILSLIGAIAVILNSALLAGASADAYRDITGHEDPETEDDAALVAPLLAPVVAEEVVDHVAHGEEPHGHDHGHDNGHGGHDDHGHGNGHDDHGHGGNGNGTGHDDHDHNGHGDHAEAHGGQAHDDDHGSDDHHDDHGGHGNGHDHRHSNGDHGHGDYGHGSHNHSHDSDASHHHHAKAAA